MRHLPDDLVLRDIPGEFRIAAICPLPHNVVVTQVLNKIYSSTESPDVFLLLDVRSVESVSHAILHEVSEVLGNKLQQLIEPIKFGQSSSERRWEFQGYREHVEQIANGDLRVALEPA